MNKKTIAMQRLFIPIILMALFFSSCQETQIEEAPSVYDDVVLSLNKGDKWVIPGDMKIYMDSSMALIKASEANESYPDDLAEVLYHQKNSFVSNCTMKGTGHDMLHEWLIPYIGLLDEFEAAPSDNRKTEILHDLLNAKNRYSEYFK